MRLAVAVLLLAATPSASAELLPKTSLHLEAARYEPTETDVHWTGWIGGSATLVSSGPSSFRFLADVETILGDTRRAFDATQANYHLELSAWREVRGWQAGLVFHHVSRHRQDRNKEPAVDWNMLRLQAAHAHRLGTLEVGLGHTTLQSQVGYGWELAARGDAALRPAGGRTPYALAALRAVEAAETDLFPRGSFVDARAEAGLRWVRGGDRRLDLFVAFEHRNDVPVTSSGTRDRALFGFRIGSAGREGLGGL